MEGMDHTDGWSGGSGDTTGVTNFQISGHQFPVVSSTSSGDVIGSSDVRGPQQVHSSTAAAFPPYPPPLKYKLYDY